VEGESSGLASQWRVPLVAFLLATLKFRWCLWIGGTDRTGFSCGMGQGVASLMAGGDLLTGERAVTLAAIVVAYLSVQPGNQVCTRCGLSPLIGTATAFVHSLGWGTILR